MKQRFAGIILALIISLVVFSGCSKRMGIEEQMNGPWTDLLKTFPPNPMPADSLELDSLRGIEFR